VLDTAIHLLRQSLAQRPVPHSRRPDSLDRLATALVTRFSHTVQIQDVDEALLLRLEALMLGHNSSEPERNADNVSICTQSISL
jgi:hypothetical protein